MENERAINFLKEKIKERLNSVQEQMGKYRYKLYIAMIEECNDFEELKEMAELDLQMDLFDYVKKEITPRLDEMNISLAEIRRADELPKELPKKEVSNETYDLTSDELDDTLSDPDTDAAMAMLLMNRIASEPAEEKYREDILDFAYEGEQPTAADVEDIDDDELEECGYTDCVKDDTEESDEDDELGEIDGLDDLDDELPGDIDESEIEKGIMTKDEIFIDMDEDEEDSFGDLDNLGENIEKEENSNGSHSNEDTGVMSIDDIFKDIDDEEIDDAIGDIGDSEKPLTEDDIFKEIDADTDDDDMSYFDGDELEDEDSDEADNTGKPITQKTEASEDSLFDLSDEEDLEGFEDDTDDEDEETSAVSSGNTVTIRKPNESDLDALFDEDDDSDLDGFLSEKEEIPRDISDTEEDEDDIDSLFKDLDENDEDFDVDGIETDTKQSKNQGNKESKKDDLDDLFGDLDEDELGLVDDTDDFFDKPKSTASKPSKVENKTQNITSKPKNAVMHTKETPLRSSGIKPTTVFSNGTERGNKTQTMFNMFNNIGIGSRKAASKIKQQTEKVVKSSFFDIGAEDDGVIDF